MEGKTMTPELYLAQVESGEVTTDFRAENLDQLLGALNWMLTDAVELRRRLSDAAGPSPAPLPAHLLMHIDIGTANIRHARDTIRAVFRARAKHLGK